MQIYEERHPWSIKIMNIHNALNDNLSPKLRTCVVWPLKVIGSLHNRLQRPVFGTTDRLLINCNPDVKTGT